MRRTLLPLAVLSACLLAAAGPAWSHIPSIDPTTVDTVTVTSGSDSVDVAGAVSFGGQSPVVLAEDPAGDNLGGPATSPLGVDVTGLAVAQRTADVPELTFELRLAQLPTSRGTPEAVQYNWDVAVDGGASAGGSSWSLKTMGTRASTQSTAPYAGVFRCEPNPTTGGFSCSEQSRVEAVYDTGSATVYVNVPLADIGAEPGSSIAAWPRSTNPVWVGGSAGGAQTVTNLFDTVPAHQDYRVPQGGSVEVAVTPSGQPATAFSPATVGSDGVFSGRLDVPGPGPYDVTVRACFADNCAERVESVTVEGE